MKAVLISIQPQWCELIASGRKTIEVRKTRPKIETPFKCYVYCSKGETFLYKNPNNGELFLDSNGGYRGGDYEDRFLTQKVIGSFVCDRIEKFSVGSLHCDDIEKESCLNYFEMINYFYKPEELDGKTVKWGYGWHISDLQIYDKPKELCEFLDRKEIPIKRAFQSWGYCYGEEN